MIWSFDDVDQIDLMDQERVEAGDGRFIDIYYGHVVTCVFIELWTFGHYCSHLFINTTKDSVVPIVLSLWPSEGNIEFIVIAAHHLTYVIRVPELDCEMASDRDLTIIRVFLDVGVKFEHIIFDNLDDLERLKKYLNIEVSETTYDYLVIATHRLSCRCSRLLRSVVNSREYNHLVSVASKRSDGLFSIPLAYLTEIALRPSLEYMIESHFYKSYEHESLLNTLKERTMFGNKLVFEEDDLVRCYNSGSGSYGSTEVHYSKEHHLLFVIKFPYDHCNRTLRIEREWLEKLEHPSIVHLFGTVNMRGRVCLVLEFCQHGSLRDFLRTTEYRSLENEMRHFYSTDFATMNFGFLMGVLHAIQYIHGEGMCHRDITLNNIVIDVYGRAKLCDFGSCRRFENSSDDISSNCAYSDRIEEAKQNKYGPESDMFGFSDVASCVYNDLIGMIGSNKQQLTLIHQMVEWSNDQKRMNYRCSAAEIIHKLASSIVSIIHNSPAESILVSTSSLFDGGLANSPYVYDQFISSSRDKNRIIETLRENAKSGEKVDQERLLNALCYYYAGTDQSVIDEMASIIKRFPEFTPSFMGVFSKDDITKNPKVYECLVSAAELNIPGCKALLMSLKEDLNSAPVLLQSARNGDIHALCMTVYSPFWENLGDAILRFRDLIASDTGCVVDTTTDSILMYQAMRYYVARVFLRIYKGYIFGTWNQNDPIMKDMASFLRLTNKYTNDGVTDACPYGYMLTAFVRSDRLIRFANARQMSLTASMFSAYFMYYAILSHMDGAKRRNPVKIPYGPFHAADEYWETIPEMCIWLLINVCDEFFELGHKWMELNSINTNTWPKTQEEKENLLSGVENRHVQFLLSNYLTFGPIISAISEDCSRIAETNEVEIRLENKQMILDFFPRLLETFDY